MCALLMKESDKISLFWVVVIAYKQINNESLPLPEATLFQTSLIPEFDMP